MIRALAGELSEAGMSQKFCVVICNDFVVDGTIGFSLKVRCLSYAHGVFKNNVLNAVEMWPFVGGDPGTKRNTALRMERLLS